MNEPQHSDSTPNATDSASEPQAPRPRRVLVIDDDRVTLRRVRAELEQVGLIVETVDSAAAARAALAAGTHDAVVLDLILPDASGHELLAEIRKGGSGPPVVVLTSSQELDDAVACMQAGAVDFATKPCETVRLQTSIENAIERRELETRVESLTRRLQRGEGFASIQGRSEALRKTLDLLKRAADNDVAILVEGESGTGKEVVARAVHAESARAQGPFIAVNCGAIPGGLIESELFGHEKDAVPGATDLRKGCFELAQGGTLFLDDIGSLTPDIQIKLLQVLQTHAVQRVGGCQHIPVDVRIIAASQGNLRDSIREGKFREDLYYRLAVFPVTLPSLRDRHGDITLLAQAFVQQYANDHGKEIRGLTTEVHEAFEAHNWPGNVRELENVIERAVILEDEDYLRIQSLPQEIVGDRGPTPKLTPRPAEDEEGPTRVVLLGDEVVPFQEQERRILLHALEHTGWNVQEAARRLRIGRATVYRKIDRYRLRDPEVRRNAI